MTRKRRLTISWVPLTSFEGHPRQVAARLQVSKQSIAAGQKSPSRAPPAQAEPVQMPVQSALSSQAIEVSEVKSRQSAELVHGCVESFEQVLGPVMTARESSKRPKSPQASPAAVQSASFRQRELPLLRQNFSPPPLAAARLSTQTGLVRAHTGFTVPHLPNRFSGRRSTSCMKVVS